MASFKRALFYIIHNRTQFCESVIKHFAPLIPDKTYLSLRYRCRLGFWPDFDNPKRFTEKLQWLKINYRVPLLTQCVDKFSAKEYVSNTIGDQYIIKNLGVWDRYEDINFEMLPSKFVLKTTNGGGSTGVVICQDKCTLDYENARIKLTHSLKTNIYDNLREWPYKNVKARIIAEEYLEDEYGELRDYKFYCFNGVPKVLLVATNRFTTHNFNYLDMSFNPMPIISTEGKPTQDPIEKPMCFDKMKTIVEQLCKPFPHVRVDMYCCHNNIYFGEFTFFDSSGFDNMSSDEWDLIFGGWLTLPPKNADKIITHV